MSVDLLTYRALRSNIDFHESETGSSPRIAAKSDSLTPAIPNRTSREPQSHFGISRLLAVTWCAALTGLLLFVFELVAVAAPVNSEQDELTKLAPEQVSVHLENGSGSLNLVLVRKAGSGVPAVKVTSAVGGCPAPPKAVLAWPLSTRSCQEFHALQISERESSFMVRLQRTSRSSGRLHFSLPDFLRASFQLRHIAQLPGSFSLDPQSNPDRLADFGTCPINL